MRPRLTHCRRMETPIPEPTLRFSMTWPAPPTWCQRREHSRRHRRVDTLVRRRQFESRRNINWSADCIFPSSRRRRREPCRETIGCGIPGCASSSPNALLNADDPRSREGLQPSHSMVPRSLPLRRWLTARCQCKACRVAIWSRRPERRSSRGWCKGITYEAVTDTTRSLLASVAASPGHQSRVNAQDVGIWKS